MEFEVEMNSEIETKNDSESVAETPFFQVLNNPQLAEKLLQYLSFKDMVDLSMTCKFFCGIVRDSPAFSKSACFKITKQTYLDRILGNTSYPWRNVLVDLSWLPPKSVTCIQDILKTVVFLKVQLTVDASEKMMEQKLNFFLPKFLQSSSVLQDLWLDPTLMQWILHDTFANLDVQHCISGLKSLRIKPITHFQNSSCRFQSLNFSSDEEDSEDGYQDEEPFPRNMLQLSLIPKKLETFIFNVQKSTDEKDKDFNIFVPNIIKTCCKTLQNLEISLDSVAITSLGIIFFPALKTLSMRLKLYLKHDNILEEILRTQPLLENLALDVEIFPRSLLNVVASRSSKLKKLHIEAEIMSALITSEDWGFLSSLKKLQDFKISCESLNNSFLSILQQMPFQIKKVALNRMNFSHEEENTLGLIAALSKIPNLVELSLLECQNAIDDDILDYICYHMQHLTALEFSQCSGLTNSGITGMRGEMSMGVSIKNLSGLKKLTIKSCDLISMEALKKTLKFSQLKVLDISGKQVISDEEVIEIVSSNPSLETLIANFDGRLNGFMNSNPFSLYLLKDAIQEANPRTINIIDSAFTGNNDDPLFELQALELQY